MEDLVDFLDPLFMNVLPISVRFMFLNTGQKLIFCGRLHTVPVWGCGSLTLYARPDHCVKKSNATYFLSALFETRFKTGISDNYLS